MFFVPGFLERLLPLRVASPAVLADPRSHLERYFHYGERHVLTARLRLLMIDAGTSRAAATEAEHVQMMLDQLNYYELVRDRAGPDDRAVIASMEADDRYVEFGIDRHTLPAAL